MIDLWEYTNSELAEMGIAPQCACSSTYREHDDNGEVYDVCVDCDASRNTGQKVRVWR